VQLIKRYPADRLVMHSPHPYRAELHGVFGQKPQCTG
jgi:hypothetical protein